MRYGAKDNIILIGMPGAGKSTVGVLLAKYLSLGFLDTDVLIQSRERKRLQEIIEERGIGPFCELEQRHILSLDCQSTVIATGGSVIYGTQAMEHLKRHGIIVFLEINLSCLKERLTDFDARGVVRAPGQLLDDIWSERMPLYRQWVDVKVNCNGLDHQQVVMAIANILAENVLMLWYE